ncbi:MAG TPA: hypothetical protein VJ558_09045, partial [Bacillales bacterium]|nr:hypothetical protein [Bacillales bacterium]
MKRTFKFLLILVLSTFVISACSQTSFKDESKLAIKTVKATVNNAPKKANNKSEKLRFYLPFGYEIKDQSPYNIILKNG